MIRSADTNIPSREAVISSLARSHAASRLLMSAEDSLHFFSSLDAGPQRTSAEGSYIQQASGEDYPYLYDIFPDEAFPVEQWPLVRS